MILILLAGFSLKATALGLTFDCRVRLQPENGFLISVEEKLAKLQVVQNHELVGPIYHGTNRSVPNGYVYVVRVDTFQDRALSFFEIWINEMTETQALYPAWYFDHAPRIHDPYAEIGIKALDCSVLSEASPKIFRTEI